MGIRTFACPKCATINTLKFSESKIFTCLNCGAMVSVEGPEIIPGEGTRILVPMSDLSLGLKGDLGGISLEIVGYIKYKASDDEDTWYWEEWLAVGGGKDYWIEYDQEEDKYIFYEQIIPTEPIDTARISSRSRIKISPAETFSVTECEYAELVAVKGEIPWRAEIGEGLNYADGSSGSNLYSLEWDEEETGLFRGSLVPAKDILRGFNLIEKLAKLEKKQQSLEKWKSVISVAWLVFIGCIIGAVASLFSGKLIYSSSFQVCDYRADPGTCSSSPMPIGPIAFDKENKVYEIKIASQTASTVNWHAVDVLLLDEGEQPTYQFEGDFWREAWQEGGESGIDSNLEASSLFRLTKAGKYYLDLAVEKQNLSSAPDQITIRIYEEVILGRYFLVLGILSFLFLRFKDKRLSSIISSID